MREAATQMARPDLFIDPRTDKVILPKTYFDSKGKFAIKMGAIIKIQCYARGWKARRVARALREQSTAEQQQRLMEENEKRNKQEDRRKKEINRRMHPKTKADFDILFNELEAWRLQETRKIKTSALSEPEKQEQLKQLLKKETKLLQTIHRLKVDAAAAAKQERIKSQLQLMASPKKWEMGDGKVAMIHTPFTARARELVELYKGLQLPLLTVDERLDVLLRVKWTVKEFDCQLTRDLVSVIDREADLLSRGRSDRSLEGLRQRIANLFLKFCQSPEFNPEAARFQRVPSNFIQRPETVPIPGPRHLGQKRAEAQAASQMQ